MKLWKELNNLQRILFVTLVLCMLGTDILLFMFDKFLFGAVCSVSTLVVGYILCRSIESDKKG